MSELPAAGPPADQATVPSELRRHLQMARRSLLRAVDGVPEYDARRPMTPSGTSLLGVVKHVSGVEAGYLGECVGRPVPDMPAWYAAVEDDPMADMWLTAEESGAQVLADYARVRAHVDAVLDELPVDAPAHVPWWPAPHGDTTLGCLLVRTVQDVAQHAGQVEILRETIDGQGSPYAAESGDADWWAAYVARVQAAAETHRS